MSITLEIDELPWQVCPLGWANGNAMLVFDNKHSLCRDDIELA